MRIGAESALGESLPVFIRNEVLRWQEKNYRVIETNNLTTFLYELDIDRGYPKTFETEEILELYFEDEIEILENHDYDPPAIPLDKWKRYQTKADEDFNLIKPIIENSNYLYSTERGQIISEQIEKTGVNKSKLYRLLRRYWARGQCKEAMIPDYAFCGAPGKQRSFTDKKPGRKSNTGKKLNAIRTDFHIQLMHRVVTVFYLGKDKDLKFTYRRFKSLCREHESYTSDDLIPSMASLRHFVDKYYSLDFIARKREGERVYLKDRRALVGTATASAYGPGARYEIDATVIDVYVVCSKDSSRVLGRPILYLVIDVFSRYIVGFYIGFHSPSYRTATIALLSAIQDKTYLLKKHKISKKVCESWPGVGLPDALLSDKAELFGLSGTRLVSMTGMRIENTASGRSDMKGIVEQCISVVQKPFSGKFDGKSSQATTKKSGAIDGRLTASFTFDKIEEILISIILVRNFSHPMLGYDGEADMPDDMAKTPANIWNWGLENRSGSMRRIDEKRLRLAVLPHASATTSNYGVCYEGLHYNSDSLIQKGWFARLKGSSGRPKNVEILFDPMCVNTIWVFIPNSNELPVECALHVRSREHLDRSFLQVKKIKEVQNTVRNNQLEVEEDELIKLEERIEQMVNAAKKDKRSANKKSKAQTIREIPGNKEQAKDAEREVLIDQYAPEKSAESRLEDPILESAQEESKDPILDGIFGLNKEVNYETNGIDDEY
ncbi:Mu transposase C-terminal domain-containing protein [Alteromonas sp. ASW11-36]|uniref:Mu transposase C-terminal domain-containing protein n=1 Tax=Alteromonas arenosi TaxID=3055817 RepID=A0ABT7T143_9ALTE|nr:Mu transposase C-terminal domain-containing protein [Alteromonas sp. ASW11-36]MDM7862163.1 Mu transposase C-terminal domain-containing protein [Alteromonas sp. ASW11-36]